MAVWVFSHFTVEEADIYLAEIYNAQDIHLFYNMLALNSIPL